MKKIVFCGIDLASKEKNCTGVACIDVDGNVIEEGILFSDRSIVGFVKRNKPKVVAIDAPLSIPSFGSMRDEERILRKEGHYLFPFFKSMRELAVRGMELDKRLDEYKVIEVCPSVSAKILGIEREKNKIRRHVQDAKIAAITAKMYHEGRCSLVKGKFYIPSIQDVKG
ncbi:MAG: DUF429 domain-containing protein [Candidatus Micrarchaeota archaeon]|nr:DUF429 domain-containing protein [Candidatus Micrarchaeota archaeon]